MDEKLKKDIEIELENLERLISQMQDLRGRIGREPDFVVTRTAGSILHDFYCGIEKIFERIAINLDAALEEGIRGRSLRPSEALLSLLKTVKVSVIITTKNEEENIANCLESIRNQNASDESLTGPEDWDFDRRIRIF